ncbi:hypothetical protein AB0L85_32120 [Streptomyces sp. NPDC052051]|uniref:hypothetical protein n=1 Tax=Streptomyces sp. NPDC052051 TaxID=3154649 RepID=UPI00343FC88D
MSEQPTTKGPTQDTRRGPAPSDLRFLEVWAKVAPIRLAGYEDDLAEPHILQGID